MYTKDPNLIELAEKHNNLVRLEHNNSTASMMKYPINLLKTKLDYFNETLKELNLNFKTPINSYKIEQFRHNKESLEIAIKYLEKL